MNSDAHPRLSTSLKITEEGIWTAHSGWDIGVCLGHLRNHVVCVNRDQSRSPRWYKAVFRFMLFILMLDFFLCLIWLPIAVHNTYGFRSAKFVFLPLVRPKFFSVWPRKGAD